MNDDDRKNSSPNTCPHNRVGSSGMLATPGMFCLDCGAKVPCRHNEGVIRRDYLGHGYEPGQCAVCGVEMP